MASSEKKPRKGILKTSTSFDNNDHHSKTKEMTWDEMNIIATHHPPDKDYGHMKIDEPPTPYSKCSDPEDDEEEGTGERRGSVSDKKKLDASSLTSRLEGIEGPRTRRVSTEEDESSDEEEELTEEQQEHRKGFEQKRKLHYNEFQAVKLAKQLMEEDDEEEDETGDDEDNGSNTRDSVQMQTDQSPDTGANLSSGIPKDSGTSALGQNALAETTVDAAGHLETQIN